MVGGRGHNRCAFHLRAAFRLGVPALEGVALVHGFRQFASNTVGGVVVHIAARLIAIITMAAVDIEGDADSEGCPFGI